MDFFGKKNEPNAEEGECAKPLNFSSTILWLLCFPLKMGTSTECPFYRLGTFLQFFSDELKRSCFHLDFFQEAQCLKGARSPNVSENRGTGTQIILFSRVFYYKPFFWGTPIFGNTHLLMH